MSTQPFVHLHCHTHYSLLDGANRIPELVERVQSAGMNAVAMTDHGNLYGAIEFYRECTARGVNPIVGYEAYVAPTRRDDREARKRGDAGYHLTLLAKNATGFKNLIKMASLAFLEGYHYVPRIDKELLAAHHEGLICLSGCASGEFSEYILQGKLDEAQKLAAWFHELFGSDFYIEIQNNGLQVQKLCMDGAVDVANRMGLPLVATSDAHYLTQADAPAHDVLLCINTGAKRSDTRRLRYGDGDGKMVDQFFVRDPAGMYELFEPKYHEAVGRTQEIANGVDIKLDFKKRHFPVFTPPAGKTPEQHLRELCEEGLRQRYGDSPRQEVRDRFEHELGIICRMGFAGYFLIVYDFVRFAVENKIPCSARGSACGALVSYVLGLSHVDPLEYDLLFERFLDPNRGEAPDIDIDFCQDRREEVIAYVKRKYGEMSVAQIATFGTLAARAAIKDVGRVLDVPLERVNQLTNMVPVKLGITIDDALEQSPDLRQAYDSDPLAREVIDIARKLEGTNRNLGTHAAGVVIANGPLTDYVPVQRVVRKGEDAGVKKGEAVVVTQWEMGDIEKVGLLKMDFLGLRTLSLVENCLNLIEKTHGRQLDLNAIPLDDRKTYELLQRGDAKGVFQFESDGIRELLKRLKPDNIRDIIACTALYRPGPLQGGMVDEYIDCKHGRRQPTYAHPVMEEVLKETHGVMNYQEQIMRILNRLGGIELSSAYACVKAISKKNHEIINKRKVDFLKGAQERGVDEDVAQDIFDKIVFFGGYGFNKCLAGGSVIVDAASGKATTINALFRQRRPFAVHALGKDGALCVRRVADVIWNGPKPVYTVRTRRGRTITATSNHPFWTPVGWVLLGDLKPGGPLASPRKLVGGAGVIWDEIDSITPAGVQQTYDLTVEEDHNFVADGLIVHNSHSAAYAHVSYQTAYLKAHYTPEFMAALLSSEIEDGNKRNIMVDHIDDSRRMGVDVLPPCVNVSDVEFTVQEGKVVFGLMAIKGFGRSASEDVVRARREGGPFKDLFDFCERTDQRLVNRAAIERLIKAGALDRLGGHRAQLLMALPRAIQAAVERQQDQRLGQGNLFEAFSQADTRAATEALPDVTPWPEADKLKYEKEALDFYFSSHPLAQHEKELQRFASHTCSEVATAQTGVEITLGGILTQVRLMNTKKARNGNTRYLRCKVEDLTGTVECVMWPDDFAKCKEPVDDDKVCFVRGSIDERSSRDQPVLLLNRIIGVEQMRREGCGEVWLRLKLGEHGPHVVDSLAAILERTPGPCPVWLCVLDAAGRQSRLRLSRQFNVNPLAFVPAAVEDVLGPGSVKLLAGNGSRPGR